MQFLLEKVNAVLQSQNMQVCVGLITVLRQWISVGLGIMLQKLHGCSLPKANESIVETKQKQVTCANTDNIATNTGVLKKMWIFCPLQSKGACREGLTCRSCESFEAETKIKDKARELNDADLLRIIGNVDFVAEEVKYHHTCRLNYLKQTTLPIKNNQSQRK